jgi:hypothetical protein
VLNEEEQSSKMDDSPDAEATPGWLGEFLKINPTKLLNKNSVKLGRYSLLFTDGQLKKITFSIFIKKMEDIF